MDTKDETVTIMEFCKNCIVVKYFKYLLVTVIAISLGEKLISFFEKIVKIFTP